MSQPAVLSERQLQWMRGQVERVLPTTALIRTRTLTTDGFGNEAVTYTGNRKVKCRLSYVSGSSPNSGKFVQQERPRVPGQYVVTLPYGTTLNDTDRLTINGTDYDIMGPAGPERSFELSKRLIVQKAVS